MDVSGAEALRLRIEQQQHWHQAAAVRDGRQAWVDPDSRALKELRGGERLYHDEIGAFAKQLIAGAWARIEIG